MSYSAIAQAAQDGALRARIAACVATQGSTAEHPTQTGCYGRAPPNQAGAKHGPVLSQPGTSTPVPTPA